MNDKYKYCNQIFKCLENEFEKFSKVFIHFFIENYDIIEYLNKRKTALSL